jgi:adenylate kinase family enzyme
VLKYYKRQGKLVSVDGMQPIADVTRQIGAAIDGKSPR